MILMDTHHQLPVWPELEKWILKIQHRLWLSDDQGEQDTSLYLLGPPAGSSSGPAPPRSQSHLNTGWENAINNDMYWCLYGNREFWVTDFFIVHDPTDKTQKPGLVSEPN